MKLTPSQTELIRRASVQLKVQAADADIIGDGFTSVAFVRNELVPILEPVMRAVLKSWLESAGHRATGLADLTEPELKSHLNGLGSTLRALVGQKSMFTLLLWDDPAAVQYLATTNRDDTIKAMRELLGRMEKGGDPTHVERVRHPDDVRRQTAMAKLIVHAKRGSNILSDAAHFMQGQGVPPDPDVVAGASVLLVDAVQAAAAEHPDAAIEASSIGWKLDKDIENELITIPTPEDEADGHAIDVFCARLRVKMNEAARRRRAAGKANDWRTSNWADDLRHAIRSHVVKGDPTDVAIYAMMAWTREWSLTEGGQTGHEGRLGFVEHEEPIEHADPHKAAADQLQEKGHALAKLALAAAARLAAYGGGDWLPGMDHAQVKGEAESLAAAAGDFVDAVDVRDRLVDGR